MIYSNEKSLSVRALITTRTLLFNIIYIYIYIYIYIFKEFENISAEKRRFRLRWDGHLSTTYPI